MVLRIFVFVLYLCILLWIGYIYVLHLNSIDIYRIILLVFVRSLLSFHVFKIVLYSVLCVVVVGVLDILCLGFLFFSVSIVYFVFS